MKRSALCIILLSLCVSMSYASWQNPLFLRELNNFQTGEVANWPTISSDENEILFVRSKGIYFYLWQATKNPETQVFDKLRLVSELNSLGGQNIFGTWLSKDSLRLYYCADDPYAVNRSWGRNLLMAIRKTPQDKWTVLKKHMELQMNQYLDSCSLTSDELNIMFAADNAGANYKIYTASRPSVFHNFVNTSEAFELEAMGARAPHLSPDGLTVYFTKQLNTINRELWIGHRKSLNVSFSEFSKIDEINKMGDISGPLCPSWDGKKVYYFQRQGLPGDLNAAGIFVSQWVDDSFPDAVANLHSAIEKKREAIQMLKEASAQERVAFSLLSKLPPQQLPPDLTRQKLMSALLGINLSTTKEDLIVRVIEGCVRNVQTSLILLVPPVPVQQ